jgi:hypothetical protein
MSCTENLNSFMKRIFATLLSVGMLMSCHKDPPAPPHTTADYCGLASVSNQSNQKMYGYEYDPDHKIRKIITYDTADGNIRYTSQFNYETTKVNIGYFNGADPPSYAQCYHLNEQGLPVMKTVITSYRNDTTYFEYDYDGYLVKSIRKQMWGVYDTLIYSYSEGRRTTVVSPAPAPSLDSIKYEYYDFELPHNTYALLNSGYDNTEDPAENEPLLGKNTDLAVKSKIVRYKNDPYHILNYEYFYEFDADSNLTKIKGVIGYLNSYSLHSYELNISVECK